MQIKEIQFKRLFLYKIIFALYKEKNEHLENVNI